MSQSGIYRGWLVLAGLMLIYGTTNGLITHSLPILYPLLSEEFAWDARTVTLPATLFMLFGALTSPPAGYYLDRYPARVVILFGLATIVAALCWFSRIQDINGMVVVYLMFALGLSCGGLLSNMLVLTRWFSRKRGLATGLLLLASSVGGALMPHVLNAFIETGGWRHAVRMSALLASVTLFLPLLLLVKGKPDREDRGRVRYQWEFGAENRSLSGGITLSVAVKQSRFYLLAFVTAALWFVVLALINHQSLYIQKDLQFSGKTLANFFSLFFGFSVIGKLVFGWLSDLVDKHCALALSAICLIVGICFLYQLNPDTRWALPLAAVFAGVGFSGTFTTIQILIAEYYSGIHYGKILGIFVMLDSIAGALGIRIIAAIRDASGGYQQAFLSMLGLLLVSLVVITILWRSWKKIKLLESGA